MAARNMKRIEINIHEKELCVKLVIYRDEDNKVLQFEICAFILHQAAQSIS